MSKKRTSPESSNDEQTTEGSDSVFQQDDHAKRAKLTTFSDTTLEDLPMELIECILIKAVAMEVEAMKLAKSVWKEKADLVANRLGTVCSQWSSILSSNFSQKAIHGILEGTAEKTIRLEILHQSPLQYRANEITSMKDEIFILCEQQNGDFAINVYDRNNVAEVKDVIPLPGIRPEHIAACSVSNCLYILHRHGRDSVRISRIIKVAKHQFNITPLITEDWRQNLRFIMALSANGNIILSRMPEDKLPAVTIYNGNGSVQGQFWLYRCSISNICQIIPKANGNIVLVSYSERAHRGFTEMNTDHNKIRQHIAAPLPNELCPRHIVQICNGWYLLTEKLLQFELCDSEFNHLACHQTDRDDIAYFKLSPHYNEEGKEVICVINDPTSKHGLLTIFRFAEE